MFKKNVHHLQGDLFSFKTFLSKKSQHELEKSEEKIFYDLIFCNIREDDFEILYSNENSRPNSPINSMVSALILYEKYGWSYEELFKEMRFNLLIRTALGLHTLEEQPFCPATLFNFQNRIKDHFIKTGENLIEKVFDNLTRDQLKLLKLKTNIQRADSFLVSSNIRNYSRLQLLIEVLLRFYRELSDEDKQDFQDSFTIYLQQSSGQYVYKLKKTAIPHEIKMLGQLYHRVYLEYFDSYQDNEIFQILERVYKEHYQLVEERIEVVANEDLHSGILQSPDDLDGTYRNKRGSEYRGESITLTETCHPDNPLDLIIDTVVQANNVDDSVVLNNRIDEIKQKTPDLDEFHTDGGFGSSANDKKMQELKIIHVQTAVRGPDAKVSISIEKISDEEYEVSCPHQTVKSEPTKTRHKATFNIEKCASCELANDCPAHRMKHNRTYYFTDQNYLLKARQKNIENIPKDRRHLRPNVEASVNEFTCKLPRGKLKVRGLFRTMMWALLKSIGINFGRIYRYLMNGNKNLINAAKFSDIFRFFLSFVIMLLYLSCKKMKNIIIGIKPCYFNKNIKIFVYLKSRAF